MNDEELKAACVMAGLQCHAFTNDGLPRAVVVTSDTHSWNLNDPALPAYVASLLVAQCGVAYVNALIEQVDSASPARLVKATDEQRIAAAMEVLK